MGDFVNGLKALTQLSGGKTYVCKAAVDVEEFGGPHPAGLPGTHIHFLDSAGMNKTVWHINYQDVMAIGALLTSGELDNRRVISLAGPAATNPRLVRTVMGTDLTELTAIEPGDVELRMF